MINFSFVICAKKKRYNRTAMKPYLWIVVIFLFFVAGCNSPALSNQTPDKPGSRKTGVPSPASPETAQVQLTPTFTLESDQASPTSLPETLPTESPAAPQASLAPAFTPTPTLNPASWQDWPVIPVIGKAPIEIYQRGQELGNHPNTFSKIGDCGSTPAWFLGDFDRGPRYYSLGEYQYLAPVIEFFQELFPANQPGGEIWL